MVDDKETTIPSERESQEHDKIDGQLNKPDDTLHHSQAIAFTGNGKEYFGIWIVNLILSIVTLGIYSAWAKVRRETYFKNNTKIGDNGFGYHATGEQIFKGRLIAFIVLVGANIIATIHPFFAIIITFVILCALPWLLNSSIRFAARMTSFRNVRFNWHGTYLQTLWFFVIAPFLGLGSLLLILTLHYFYFASSQWSLIIALFLGLISMGLLLPLTSKVLYSYFASTHSYGTTRFDINLKTFDYYYAFLIGAIIPTLVLSCVVYAIIALGQTFGIFNPFTIPIEAAVIVTVFYAFIFSMAFIYAPMCRNLMMKGLTLSNVAKFDSDISPWQLIWITFSNLVMVIVSIGLLSPWAHVRLHRYFAEVTTIHLNGDIDKFVDDASTSRSSFGEEFAEFEGVEVSI